MPIRIGCTMESNGEVPEEDFIATLLKQSSGVSHVNKAYSTTPTGTSGPPDLVRNCHHQVRHNGHHYGGNHVTILAPKDNASPHASHSSLTDPLLDDKVYSALAYGMYGLLLFILTMVTTICLIVFTWITPFSHYKIINMRKLISWHRDISFNSLLRSRRKINRIFQFYTQWQKSLYHRFGINDSILSAKETLDNLYKSAETACLGGKKHP